MAAPFRFDTVLLPNGLASGVLYLSRNLEGADPLPPQQPRPYQQEGIRDVFAAWASGARSILMIMPTGSGKTTVFSWIAAQIKAPVVVLVHRRELATQAASRLQEFGVDFGMIMAGEPTKPYARVQIASVQTLVRRKVPKGALIIADEAHLSTAATWTKILEQYPQARILGCTATPWRLAGKPLIGAYDATVVVATPRQLREQGHLCGYNGFSYLAPDLSAVKTTGADYNEKQSAEAMRAPAIVANIVEQWMAHAQHLSTVVFAVTVEHSQQLTEEFRSAGVRAEHLDGKTPREQRKAILARVESGATRVLCNVGVAVEGLDIPRLKCCVLARPTKSLARAIQMMGRVRRPWNGETARIHDHAFLIKQHGLPDADRDYSLSAKAVQPPSLTQCETCLAMYQGANCPACGGENEPQVRGERLIETVPDAEQFTFTHEEQAEAAEEARRMAGPVRIDWGDRSIGRTIEGIYQGARDTKTQWGTQTLYRLRGEKRDFDLPGTMVLNRKMRAVKSGARVRVTYLGADTNPADVHSRTRKRFSVEVDDGT